MCIILSNKLKLNWILFKMRLILVFTPMIWLARKGKLKFISRKPQLLSSNSFSLFSSSYLFPFSYDSLISHPLSLLSPPPCASAWTKSLASKGARVVDFLQLRATIRGSITATGNELDPHHGFTFLLSLPFASKSNHNRKVDLLPFHFSNPSFIHCIIGIYIQEQTLQIKGLCFLCRKPNR